MAKAKTPAGIDPNLLALGVPLSTLQGLQQMYSNLPAAPQLAQLTPTQAIQTLADLPIPPALAQQVQQSMAPPQQQQQPQTPAYQAPIITQPPPQAAPPAPPPPPPPPPQAQMDWGGLASSLQSMLAPYLSGQANPATAGAGNQVVPTLLNSLAGYLGQLQPTMAGQQAAASQTPLTSAATSASPGGTMNWSGLQQQLQSALSPYASGAANPATAGAGGNALQGQLMNQLLGYLGTVPKTQTPPTTSQV